MRIVIIGGVAGGMSAATRARRMNESAEIVVLEKGGFISFANCGLPYFLGGQIKSQDALLVTTPDRAARRYNLDIRVRHEVTKIDRAQKRLDVTQADSGATYTLTYDKLILATGATPIIPPIEHVTAPNVRLLRSMEDTIAIDRWIKLHQPKRVAIVGAGFVGLEMAEAMRDRGLEVTVIEKAPHALPPIDMEMAQVVHEELQRHRVSLIVGVGLASLRADGERVTGVGLEDGRIIDADIVLLSIGVRPNVQLATDAGLKLGASGAVEVDGVQRTSDPDIYAVGDLAEVTHGVTHLQTRIPLAGPANRQGRLAGEHAARGEATRGGMVLGTAIVKVFDLTVAVTGLSERESKRQALDYDTAYVLPAHHAGYFPGAEPMRLKLIFEKPTGRVLGAQIVGGAGVDKRIDVIATAMQFRATIDDLAQLDLAYAPPYGSAKDPVHMAAFTAKNQQSELTRAIGPEQIRGEVLVDVRTAAEFAGGTIAGAVNIPLDDLRGRLGELDAHQPTLVFCQAGLRGYIAQRLLKQHDFDQVLNLKGGYSLARMYPSVRKVLPPATN